MTLGQRVRLVALTVVGKGMTPFEAVVGQEGEVVDVRVLVRFPERTFWCAPEELVEEVETE